MCTKNGSTANWHFQLPPFFFAAILGPSGRTFFAGHANVGPPATRRNQLSSLGHVLWSGSTSSNRLRAGKSFINILHSTEPVVVNFRLVCFHEEEQHKKIVAAKSGKSVQLLFAVFFAYQMNRMAASWNFSNLKFIRFRRRDDHLSDGNQSLHVHTQKKML